MSSLTSDERIVLNNLQGGLPITPRPFEKLSEELGLDEGTILGTLRRLRKNNRLSRFGAVLNTRAMGGDSRLAAVSVPEDSRDQAASVINDYRTVTHNYVRDHDLNLWFVLSARSADRIDSTMGAIEDELGETVFDLPKLTEYYVGLRFKFLEDGSVKTVSVDDDYGHVPEGESNGLSERQRDLILELQDGLPLTKRPYRDLGGQVGFTEQTTMNVLESLLEEGKIKRLGCVPNHYALGIRGNGMVVFDVPDARVDAVGRRLGGRDEVTHCYRRPRYRPQWPYNLFAMVHDRTRSAARELADSLRSDLGLEDFPYEVLFSEELLKKTGLRIPNDSGK